MISAVSFVEFDTYNLPCAGALFWIIPVARYILYVCKSPSICFWGTKYDVYCKRVASISRWRRARLWLELFSCKYHGYLPSCIFLRRRRCFTSRKLYACLEKFLCFSSTIWSSLCFWSSMYRFIPPLIVLVPQDSNVTLLTVLLVVYAIVRLS